MWGGKHFLYAEAVYTFTEVCTISFIAITQEIFRCHIPGESFNDLRARISRCRRVRVRSRPNSVDRTGRAIVLMQGPYDSRGKKVNEVNTYDVFGSHST